MTLVKRNGQSASLFPSFFDDFLNRDLFNWGNFNFSDTNTTVPSVNISETDETYEVELAAPGMAKEDFKIELNDNTLTIRSEKSAHRSDEPDVRYFLKEFSYESFQRTLNFQREVVDLEKIQAKYHAGLLLLSIPKKTPAKHKEARFIQVS